MLFDVFSHRSPSFDLADNGEVIVTLLPVNEKFPWVTPARFRPELVPEELMAPVLTVSGTKLPFENDQRSLHNSDLISS